MGEYEVFSLIHGLQLFPRQPPQGRRSNSSAALSPLRSSRMSRSLLPTMSNFVSLRRVVAKDLLRFSSPRSRGDLTVFCARSAWVLPMSSVHFVTYVVGSYPVWARRDAPGSLLRCIFGHAKYPRTASRHRKRSLEVTAGADSIPIYGIFRAPRSPPRTEIGALRQFAELRPDRFRAPRRSASHFARP